MSNFTSGFQELANKLNQAKQKVPTAIDNAILETGYDVVAIAKDRSPSRYFNLGKKLGIQ